MSDDPRTLISQKRYLSFGQVRTDLGSISQTDLTYTGQRNLSGTGLMDYKARFYSPYINRFLQPDTIIPDQSNPQSWNRFSYVINNPILLADPTGHDFCDYNPSLCSSYYEPGSGLPGNPVDPTNPNNNNPDDELSGGGDPDEDDDGFPEEPDPAFPPVTVPESHLNCDEDTYVECFYARELFNIDGTMMIDDGQFNQLLLAIFYDVHNRRYISGPWTQVGYDTPFYDGAGKAPGSVCFQGGACYQRSEVNYVAQGMLAKSMGLTKFGGKLNVYAWKGGNYLLRIPLSRIPGSYSSPKPSEGTMHWYEFGYNLYSALLNSIDPLGISTHQ